jgi:succinate-acetate transporter protein
MSILRQRTTDTVTVQDVGTEAGTENGSGPAFPTWVVLQPIAAPSVLGWFAFAGATFVVAAWMAGWYGSPATPDYLFPFAALVGGMAQFLAGMWSYRARDVLATAMHGTWGAFWLGWGVLWALFATGRLQEPTGTFSSFGYWFIALAFITASGAVAALARGIGLFGLLSSLTAGSVLTAAGYLTNSDMTLKVAGYFLIVSAAIAWYEASAMLFADSFRRVVLPLGTYSRADNVPGAESMRVIEWAPGEPGIRHGQ